MVFIFSDLNEELRKKMRFSIQLKLKGFDLNEAEAIQVSIGPGLGEEELNKSNEIAIIGIRLE